MLVLYLVIGLVIAVLNIIGLWMDAALREIWGIEFSGWLLIGSIFVIVMWPITLMCVTYRFWRDKVD